MQIGGTGREVLAIRLTPLVVVFVGEKVVFAVIKVWR